MIEVPPTDDPRPAGGETVTSLVLLNTGDGKGKSTAAFGVMLRALALDWHVGVVQFLKSGGWKTGEEAMGRRLGVDWWAIGEGFTWDSDDLTEDEAVAQEAWAQSQRLIQGGDHRLVILDEITYLMNWGWMTLTRDISLVHQELVASGRAAWLGDERRPLRVQESTDMARAVRAVKGLFGEFGDTSGIH